MKLGYDAKRIFHNNTGLGNYSRDLIRILSKNYPNNKYFLYNPKPSKIKRLIPDGKVLIERQPKKILSKKLHFIWRSKWIIKDLIEDKIDIFHGLSGELPYGINHTNIKTVVTIHDLIFVRYPELYKPLDRRIYLKKFQDAANNADIIVAISEQTKRDIVDFLNINPKKIKVIYQGCHPVFKKEDLSKHIIEKFNLPETYILNVGAIIERKNLLTLVKSIKKTNNNLVVVGTGNKYLEKVKKYIGLHNLQNKVFFLNGVSLEELAVLYKNASLFVYPSKFEGFGIPIIEALYSKTPVITSKGSCFSEAGGAHSMYVEPNDVEALSNAITKVLNNIELQQKMKTNGWKFVQKFNDEILAKQWIELYNSL